MLMKRITTSPVFLAVLFFIIALTFNFTTLTRMEPFLEEHNVSLPPQGSAEVVALWPVETPETPTGVEPEPTPATFSALGPLLIFIFTSILVMGLILFLIPLSMLKYVMRLVFAFLFSWGVFILLIFWLPVAATLVITIAAGLAWFLVPKVWLHNLLMAIAMAGVGTVFGRFIPPWTAMVMLLILAVYDFLAVRFGYMLWMVKKLSDSTSLPAFVLPRVTAEWKANLNGSNVTKLLNKKPVEREFAILGGGDIGFPLLLISSSYFAYGPGSAGMMAAFALVGLIGAFFIQSVFLKGKPIPALPPIAAFCLVGLLILRFI